MPANMIEQSVSSNSFNDIKSTPSYCNLFALNDIFCKYVLQDALFESRILYNKSKSFKSPYPYLSRSYRLSLDTQQ